MDEEVLEQIRAAFADSDAVDASRIRLDADRDRVILRGAVATPEEASLASLLAEHHAPNVVSELQVDHGLREGADAPVLGEPTVPPEDEILVGSPDMLAGPEAAIEADVGRAMEENVPWEPPDEPHLAGTLSEYRSRTSDGGPEEVDEADPDPDAVALADRAAPDVTQHELEQGRVPSLDPTGSIPAERPQPDPRSVDDLGRMPPEGASPVPEPYPGAEPGPGATGEGTAGGGSVAGTPATETGARGADTRAADPVRGGSGGTMSDSGTERGPEARDDEALREDFPQRDP